MLKQLLPCLLLCAVLLPHSGKGQTSLMDLVDKRLLDTLIVHAKQNYPRIKLLQARIDASSANLSRQKAGWFESLTFSYVVQPPNNVAVNATKPVFLTGYQLGAYINIGSLIQRPSVIKQAKEELKQVQYEAEEYSILLTNEVRKRYYTYLQNESMWHIISKSVIDGQAQLQSAQIRYEKSELSFEQYSVVLITTNGNLKVKAEIEGNVLAAISAIEELTGPGFIELKKQYGTK